MIVDENDRSGIEFERAPEDCPGIDRKLRKGSVLELLVSEEPPCPVEEQYAQHLDRKRTHRRNQILEQLRVEGVDHLGETVATQPIDHHVARADQEPYPRQTRPENAAEGYRTLLPEAATVVAFRGYTSRSVAH